MDEFQKELLQVFRQEVAESLDRLAEILRALRSQPAGREARGRAQEAFRLAHNVKGAARTVGLDLFEQLAHGIEDVLAGARTGERALGAEELPALMRAVTSLERMLEGEDLGDAFEERIAELAAHREGPRPPGAKRGKRKRSERESEAAEPAAPAAAEGAAAADAAHAASVRVEVGRLDRVMGHVGELLVTQARQGERCARLVELGRRFRELERGLPDGARGALRAFSRELERMVDEERNELTRFASLTDEIGDSMKRLRMLPLASQGPALRRVVREAAQELGREVRLDLAVGEVELDKHVLDELRDPLMHLLRNAVAHGIEVPEARRAAGKPAEGVVRIGASLAGAKVALEIADDGAGIDTALVLRTAEQKGLVDAARAAEMSPAEIAALVFEPGFSTAREVSRVSGRGVGLDVVRDRVRALGGSVELRAHAELGGAGFRLTVPVSLVSSRVLLVRCGEAVCALPVEHVARTLRVPREAVRLVEGSAAVELAGEDPIRLRWLAPLVGQRRAPDAALLGIVIVDHEQRRLGLAVDAILGIEEHVTRPLPWNLADVPGIAGSIVLGDGSLALVVNVAHAYAAGDAGGGAAEAVQAPARTARRRILVVDDSLTSRILQRNILSAAGFEVETAADGADAWRILQQSSFDLVVSDVEMPVMTGLELVRRIREHPTVRHVPVVFVTSLDRPADRAAGAEAGANEYIVKGHFDQRVLLEAVGRLI